MGASRGADGDEIAPAEPQLACAGGRQSEITVVAGDRSQPGAPPRIQPRETAGVDEPRRHLRRRGRHENGGPFPSRIGWTPAEPRIRRDQVPFTGNLADGGRARRRPEAFRQEEDDVGFGLGEDLPFEQHEFERPEILKEEPADGRRIVDAQQLRRQDESQTPARHQELRSVDDEGRPTGRQSGDRHARPKCRQPRGRPHSSLEPLVADVRRIPDDGLALTHRLYVEEIADSDARRSSGGGHPVPGLIRRRPVDLHTLRRRAGGPQAPQTFDRGNQEGRIAARRVEHAVRSRTDRPGRDELGYRRGGEERAPRLAQRGVVRHGCFGHVDMILPASDDFCDCGLVRAWRADRAMDDDAAVSRASLLRPGPPGRTARRVRPGSPNRRR